MKSKIGLMKGHSSGYCMPHAPMLQGCGPFLPAPWCRAAERLAVVGAASADHQCAQVSAARTLHNSASHDERRAVVGAASAGHQGAQVSAAEEPSSKW